MYPPKLIFKVDGEVKYFYDKEHFKKFLPAKPALQTVLKDILERSNEANSDGKSERMNTPDRMSS